MSSCGSACILYIKMYREKQLMEEKWKSRDELLKRREDFAKRAEIEVEQRLKDEITKCAH